MQASRTGAARVSEGTVGYSVQGTDARKGGHRGTHSLSAGRTHVPGSFASNG